MKKILKLYSKDFIKESYSNLITPILIPTATIPEPDVVVSTNKESDIDQFIKDIEDKEYKISSEKKELFNTYFNMSLTLKDISDDNIIYSIYEDESKAKKSESDDLSNIFMRGKIFTSLSSLESNPSLALDDEDDDLMFF